MGLIDLSCADKTVAEYLGNEGSVLRSALTSMLAKELHISEVHAYNTLTEIKKSYGKEYTIKRTRQGEKWGL